MFSNVTHVLLDVDNTLLDFEKCAEKASRRAAEDFGIAPESLDFAVFTEINNALWAALERGEIRREEIHRTRWQKVFAALDIDADGEAFEGAFLAAIPAAVVPVEGAHELLTHLSRRYRLYAASNAPHAQQLTRLKAAGMLDFFSDVFTSESLGAAKPSTAFFEGVFSALEGVLPQNCVMIGDSLTADVVGASRFGLKTVFFDFFHSGQTSPFADCTVAHLSEICLLL